MVLGLWFRAQKVVGAEGAASEDQLRGLNELMSKFNPEHPM